MSSEVAVKDNDFLRQFETRIDGKLAKIEYSSQEKKIFLTKLVIPENLGDDFKDDFIISVLQLVEQRNLRVVPTSPEIARFLRKHKEYKNLLPVGIRI
ncbi:GNAT family N-acetyltransferase [Sinomicrobium sp.]